MDLVYALIKTKARDRLNKMKQSIVVHPVCEWLPLMKASEKNSVQSLHDALTLENVLKEL